MDDPVRLCVLRGKLLNTITELSARALVKDSGFKTLISTEEPVFMNPKFLPPFMYTPIAKHVIATNELPRVVGRTAEVFNRLLILPLEKVIALEDQDGELAAKLAAEMEGIFGWAVRGAQALVASGGRFTQPAGREAVLAGWRVETNPVLDWMTDNVVEVDGYLEPLAKVALRAAEHLRQRVTSTDIGKAAKALGIKTDSKRPAPKTSTARCLIDWKLESPQGGMGDPEEPQTQE